ncbi:unnamed protein product [Brassica oleracea var. botrytis]
MELIVSLSIKFERSNFYFILVQSEVLSVRSVMFVKHITSYALVVPRSRKCAPSVILVLNKDNNPKKSDDAATRSDSSKVGDVFPSTSLDEYANKSGRVDGIVGLGNVPDHVHHDDDESGHGSDEDHSGDDEHDFRQGSGANESSTLPK